MKIDYHGVSLSDALSHSQRLLDTARIAGSKIDVEFITGHGVIREELMKQLRFYGLNPTIKLGNTGIVVCLIE